ncbi:MAG: hypothetical protein ACE5M4_09105 [Anaerolineales bacterium]
MSDDAERAVLHRWAVKYKLEPGNRSIWFEPEFDGDWVKHEDAVAALREARAQGLEEAARMVGPTFIGNKIRARAEELRDGAD